MKREDLLDFIEGFRMMFLLSGYNIDFSKREIDVVSSDRSGLIKALKYWIQVKEKFNFSIVVYDNGDAYCSVHIHKDSWGNLEKFKHKETSEFYRAGIREFSISRDRADSFYVSVTSSAYGLSLFLPKMLEHIKV